MGEDRRVKDVLTPEASHPTALLISVIEARPWAAADELRANVEKTIFLSQAHHRFALTKTNRFKYFQVGDGPQTTRGPLEEQPPSIVHRPPP